MKGVKQEEDVVSQAHLLEQSVRPCWVHRRAWALRELWGDEDRRGSQCLARTA